MSSNDVQRLREITSAGIMDCKRALDDSKGDFEAAKALIMERGIIKAEKKAGRATGAGILETYVHNGRVGVLLDLRCETDFVVKSDPFKVLAKEIVMQIAAMNPANIEELLAQPFIKDPAFTIDQLIKNTIAKVGENMKVEKFCRYEL